MKNYGTITYQKQTDEYTVTAPPHVLIRLKALFPRINAASLRTVTISATDENSRDLEWFITRYPMTTDHPGVLDNKARAYDARMEEVQVILDYGEIPQYHMALPPRDYQRVAAALAERTRGMLCADELGLGKTITALTLLSVSDTLPALVVCPTHLPTQWEREIHRFLPGLTTHILKKGTPYQVGHPDILISNYHKLYGWMHHLQHIRTVVFDECQELRRHVSNKYAAAKCIADNAVYRMGCSATPIYNYGDEFFNVMDVLSPGTLGSRYEFLREWCRESWGKYPVRDPEALGEYLRDAGLLIRRTKKEVERELPPLTKIIHEVEADLHYLHEIESSATELARLILGGAKTGLEMLQASGEFSAKLRQATGVAKAPYVAAFTKMLLEDGESVVLFAYHHEVYKILAERLAEFSPVFFTGLESPVQKQKSLDAFLTGESKLCIMSLRSGSGVDGMQAVCSRVVFGELDWSPGVLHQCIGRVHRDGQIRPVFAYYLTALDGCDPTMIDVLGVKSEQLEGVLAPEHDMLATATLDPEYIKRLAKDYLAHKREID